MVKVVEEELTLNALKLSVGYFDVYRNFRHRDLLRKIFQQLFALGDTLYLYCNRIEDLTDDTDLSRLLAKTFRVFEQEGVQIYIDRIDERRFSFVASITYSLETPNFLIDLWKCFYSFSCFKPINKLSLAEYVEYLKINGAGDVDGKDHIGNYLTEMIFIKGLGADYLIVSHLNTLAIADGIASLVKSFR